MRHINCDQGLNYHYCAFVSVKLHKSYLIWQERWLCSYVNVYILWFRLVMARLLNSALGDLWDLEFFDNFLGQIFFLK